MQRSDGLLAFSDKRAPERFALRFDRAQMLLDAATQGLGVALECATNAGLHRADVKLKPVFGLDKTVRVKAHFVDYPAQHARCPVRAIGTPSRDRVTDHTVATPGRACFSMRIDAAPDDLRPS